VEALFVPQLVADSGDVCVVVRVQNVHDPQNALYFTMYAHIIAGTALRFQKSGGRQMSDLAACVGNTKSGEGVGELVAQPFAVVMPEMVLPVAADVKCSEMFQVTNAWKEPLELSVGISTIKIFKKFTHMPSSLTQFSSEFVCADNVGISTSGDKCLERAAGAQDLCAHRGALEAFGDAGHCIVQCIAALWGLYAHGRPAHADRLGVHRDRQHAFHGQHEMQPRALSGARRVARKAGGSGPRQVPLPIFHLPS